MTRADPHVRDLQPLFEPRSLVVVGASRDPSKWGHDLARCALAGEHRRTVYLVNRNGGEILGRRAYRSVTELPEAPDLALVAVQAGVFTAAVEDALAGGVRAFVAITAGLGETGPEAAVRERALVEQVRAAGAVMMGPNCLGIFDAQAELEINPFTPGPVGFISQSGNFAYEFNELIVDHGLGISRFASLGNQADLEVAETVAAFAAHEPTRVIAVYCEDFRDGRAFVRAAAMAAEAGKPVVLLDSGRSTAGCAAARAHTGALVSDDRALKAACAAGGVLRVSSPRELADVAAALATGMGTPGRRVAVLSDGGGSGAVACDVLSAHGFEVPAFSDTLVGALDAALGPEATIGNPIDLAAAGPRDLGTYERAARILLASAETDLVLLTGFFGGYSRESAEGSRRETEVARAIGRAAAESGVPLVAQSMYADSAPARALRESGVAVYRDIAAAVGVLAALRRRDAPRAAVHDPRGPAGGAMAPDTDAVARQRLAAVGIPVLRGEDRGADGMGGVELVVGAFRDVRFGPVAYVRPAPCHGHGPGEVAADLAPLDEPGAERLLRSLDDARSLGDAPLDVAAAARALRVLSRLIVERPEVSELEIAPLRVTAAGAVALGMRIVTAAHRADTATGPSAAVREGSS